MIQEFQVKNFYSIREPQVVSFIPNVDHALLEQYTHEVKPGVRLLKLGIVYGANASGKSTLLQAIAFFREIMLIRPAGKMDGMGYLPFMLDSHSRTERSSMQMSFYIKNERFILSVEFDSQRIYHENLTVYVTNRPTLLYKRIYDAESDHSIVSFGSKVGLTKKSKLTIAGNTTNNCTVMAAFGQSNVEASRLNDVFTYFASSMRDLLMPRMDMLGYVKTALKNDDEKILKDFLLKVMKASDFNIVDFTLNENEEPISPELEKTILNAPISEEARIEMLRRGTIRHDDLLFSHVGADGNYELNEVVESQGTKRFMGMAVMLYNLLLSDSFIPIDEVETSIHYELLAYFIKLFLANSERSSQLLMTTHDINLLDEDFIRRDVIWFTDKDNDGATLIKRLTSLGLHKTISPYNAYRQGKLVKLPFLGSIFLESTEA